jgi:predicted ribosomally synthesized peptide with SipW-like signal peptide
MTGKAMLLNKQIWLAVGMVTFIGAVVASGTGAFFSDTADVTGNTFAAGTLDLQLTENEDGGSPADTLSALWNFTNMAPGGTPEESSVWLRNVGSVDGATLGVSAAFSNNGLSPSQVAIAKQMRITEMTLDGNNLLVGGAGAIIPEYEAPTSCDITVGGSGNPATLTNAIAAASAGDVICATGTNYSETWEGSPVITVNQEVTIASVNGPDNTSSIGFNVISDNVTIRGFNIVTSEATGVQVNDADNVTIEHLTFNNFGDIAGSGNKQALYLVNGSSNALVQYNTFDGVRNGSASIKAIYVGHTAGTPGANAIEISNNIIENVESATRGGYGVLINAAGATSNVLITNNTFSNIAGGWMHAVGLEGDTPSAEVTLNTFDGLTATGADKTAVFFESNPSASSVVINENNFDENAGGVALHPINQAGGYTIDATNNWWGDFDASDQVFAVNSTVNTAVIAGGPFAGQVGGADANSNGYADLDDLRLTGITGITPGLDSYTGSNDQEFVLAVQLDGPTTGNNFQGASLVGYEVEFSLNQI